MSSTVVRPDDLTEAHATDPDRGWVGGRDKAVLLVGHSRKDFVTRSSTGKTLKCMDPMDPRVTYICNTIIPQLCRLARTFYGRIVVQLGMDPRDWGYAEPVASAWRKIFDRCALAWQACGCIVVNGSHVGRSLPRADSYHLVCTKSSVRAVAEWLVGLLRLAGMLTRARSWLAQQDKLAGGADAPF